MEVASDLFFRFGTCIRLKWFIGGGGGGDTFGSSQGHNHYRHWGGHVFPQYSDQIEAYTLNLALFKYLIFSYIIGSSCIITIIGTYFIYSQQNKWQKHEKQKRCYR